MKVLVTIHYCLGMWKHFVLGYYKLTSSKLANHERVANECLPEDEVLIYQGYN